ncbi:hypothetical protein [Frankia sp. AgPm24]|uniref:hypothetical protein n=1 Tax=Frankia sp. AgPm24 TaxID=631128 RepID=UPI00200E3047|nr:hypothetical protein [Frankia sp. AgPm24]
MLAARPRLRSRAFSRPGSRARSGAGSRSRLHARSRSARPLAAATVMAALAAVTACGADTTGAVDSGRVPRTSGSAVASHPADHAREPEHAMPDTHGEGTGVGDGSGDGLAVAAGGVRLVPATTQFAANWPVELRFQIRGVGGQAITRFVQEQDAAMHLYLIRSDLVGFQHVHPTMAADGTWTATLAAPASGLYRAYAAFTTAVDGRANRFVLSVALVVPGAAVPTPVPAPATTTVVDGYTLSLATPQGPPRAGTTSPLTVTVSRDGQPVTDLQPYLASYAHLSAFHQDDLAFAHLHPLGPDATGRSATGRGGPTLTFDALLPRPGAWRIYLQFRAAGQLHTAALTLTAR